MPATSERPGSSSAARKPPFRKRHPVIFWSAVTTPIAGPALYILAILGLLIVAVPRPDVSSVDTASQPAMVQPDQSAQDAGGAANPAVDNASGSGGRGSGDSADVVAPGPADGQVPPAVDPGQTALPADAVVLGGVDLERYCTDGWDEHAVLRFPVAWGWRCSPSSIALNGNREGDRDVDVSTACYQQYGVAASPHYRSYDDPMSWFCWES